jgi:ATP synthase subunit 6
MLIILNGIIISLFLFSFIFFNFFKFLTRYSMLNKVFIANLESIIRAKVTKFLILFLFIMFFIINLSGNIPLNSIPTLFYSQTLTIRLLFWVPIIICVSLTQFKDFIAHILPYGSPVGLILFLPLVEIFSQLIRPFTLIIRLRTNLSRGHIIIYIFRYFTLLSSLLAPFIYVVLYALFILELCISMLQAYIFVSLISLYINETV